MSEIWKYYTKDNTTQNAICNICENSFKYSGSTSTLWSHIRKKHKWSQEGDDRSTLDSFVITDSNPKNDEVKILPSTSASTSTSPISSVPPQKRRLPQTLEPAKQLKITNIFHTPDINKKRQEIITQSLTSMIARDMLPISFVEGIGFKNFMRCVEPSYTIPSRGTIQNRVDLIYNIEKQKILTNIKEIKQVSLTTDCWTARNNDSYMTVTLHGITKNWELCEHALTTSTIGRHTAENLAEKLRFVTSDWEIGNKIVATVSDNAANIVKAVTDNSDFLGELVRCFGHSLQLALGKGLEIGEIKDLITRCSSLVGYFNHSSVATVALKKTQNQLDLPEHKLIQCVTTRWNSTYYMLERLNEQRRAVLDVLNDRSVTTNKQASKHNMSNNDWTMIDNLIKVLHPFEVATRYLSGDKYPTLSMVTPIAKSMKENYLICTATDEDYISSFKKCVSEEFDKRFYLKETLTNNFESISIADLATYLDPRYKNIERKMGFRLKVKYELEKQIRIMSEKKHEMTTNAESEDNMKSELNILFPEDSVPTNFLSEVEQYNSELLLRKDQNPLTWWKNNENKYTFLSVLARKYLCVPATSTSSERVFSSAGNIISAKRNCLLPENADKLIFLHQNLTIKK